MSNNKSIGNFIKHHRIASGFHSQRQLAEKSGISSATISRVESELQKPNIETLKTLSRFLKTTSLFDLMVVAEYWEKDDDNDKLLSTIYTKEHMATEELLDIVKMLTNDEGKFKSEYHEGIFNIFGGYVYDPNSINDEHTGFDEWFFNDYLGLSQEELDESIIDEAIEKFDKYYNYYTIKHSILSLDKRFSIINKTIDDFLEEIKNFCDKHRLSVDKGKMTNLNASSSQTVKIPILGVIACSDPILAKENIIGYKNESLDDLPSGIIYYVKVVGNSMEPTIPTGSRVLIREQSEVEYGDIAAVLVNGNTEIDLKKIMKQGDTVLLMPINRSHEPIIVSEENPIKIIGKVIRYTKDL